MNSQRVHPRVVAGISFLLLTAACSGPAAFTPPPSAASQPAPTLPIEPSPRPYPFPGMATVGPVEVVFDWTVHRCEPLDIPDLPARAFRDADGNVQLISAHLASRRLIGPTLGEVARDCAPVLVSTHDSDPARFADNEWIASTYTEDGTAVYAVIHNEFHGWEHGRCTGDENFACWYNALTMAVSNDGGESFRHIATPPDHLVANLPYPYEDAAGPYGVFEPGNIIKKDNAYYMFVRVDEYKSDSQRVCLLRTTELADPASWRAWDGRDFSVVMGSPYEQSEGQGPARHCAAMDPDLGMLESSITYNTFLNRYVMVGISTDNFSSDREIWGVMYAFSDDLIDWERRVLLFETPLPWSVQAGNPRTYLYPALIDPESESRNFETSGKSAYLYLTRFNGGDPLDRDLIRIPVEFFPTVEEADAAKVPFAP